MRYKASVTGIGWVSKKSMGHPDRFRGFEQPHRLPPIRRRDVLEAPYKPFGRMDDFSTLGFSAIAFALAHAGVRRDAQRKDFGLVASTSTGCVQTDIDYWKSVMKDAPSPALFAYTLDSCFLGEAASCFGLTGENYVINEHAADGRAALYFALEQIGTGQTSGMVCGVCNSQLRTAAAEHREIVPGALFCVLEKQRPGGMMTVAADSPESIYDENLNAVADLFELARQCRPDVEIEFKDDPNENTTGLPFLAQT